MEAPPGFDAHHVFPQALKDRFKALGIDDIDDPAFGAWWKESAHRAASGKYQEAWVEFLKRNPSREEIIDFGKTLAKEFRFDWQF